ncbi:hypothetical protein [Streptomyces sp. TLI_146]|uniref:hypothetical protein n=1 Tax=Streptomyces sp. TLI_146 TaxID=1938858 RepID=UPI000CB4CE55|nr:hypothetical protein [Streptomyces sp. TLI_146]PKV82584.1 chromosome segregation ATPase [Streptomyces sp. TLI_146]
MLQLRRLRLENIGHRAAGFKSLVLDLMGGPSVLDGRPLQPVDVILWLRNGGGKSSLLSLLFSLLLPAKRDFIGAAKAKSLAEYVPDGQVSHVIAEWGDSERPASGAVLLTGGVYQWRDRQRPADVSGGWERLERRWYLLRPQPGGLELDSLPVRAADGQLTMSMYVKELQAANKAERRLQLSVAEEQFEWEEALDNHGLDPQVFKIQKAMNQEEGGITDLFKFRTAEEFIDFLIDMVIDAAAPTAAREALSHHADKLAARPARELEERFLAKALVLLHPVQKATAEVAAAEQALYRQARLARRAGEHVQVQAELQEQQAGTLRQEAEVTAREGQQAEERVTERRQSVAAVREAAERLQMGEREREHAAQAEAAGEGEREAAAWKAVPVLMQLADQENQRREVKQLLARAHSEQAPLREAMEEAGAALHFRLEDSFARLSDEMDQSRTDAEEAGARAQASEQEYEEAMAAAGRAENGATSAEAHRTEEHAKITAARRSGLLGTQEEPHEALARLAQEEAAAREQVEGARGQLDAAREQVTALAAERVACAGRLSTARQQHDQVWEQWNTLSQERRDLAIDPRLREVAGIADAAAELDLDEVGADLVALLADQVADADTELAAERAKAFEDERLRAALERDGFCPPPREVEQAVAALRSRGANAVAGVQFLRETVPAHQHDDVMAAIPHLIGGVVICGPVPGGDLAALARQADVALPTVLSVAADVHARALLSQPLGDIAVLPLRRSVLDAEAGEEELHRVTARLATVEERCAAITRRRENDRSLIVRLHEHLEAFGARARAGLEERLGRLDEEVNTLTERTSVLVRQAAEAEDAGRRAERQLKQHTEALMAFATALPTAQALVEAARAVERWAAQGQQARAEAREHRAAAQAFKARWRDARKKHRAAEAALRQGEERKGRWTGWASEIRQEVSGDVLRSARPATVADGSVQALRERWVQARRDWRDGISDPALQQRLTAAETAIEGLNEKLAETGSTARARAAELVDEAAAMDTERLSARIAAAEQACQDAVRAEAHAELLLRQATTAHTTAAAALDECPGAQRLTFPSARHAQEELQKATQLLEEDLGLAQVRRLDAEKIHRRADQAASHAAQFRQSAAALRTAGEHQALDERPTDAAEMSVDALLLEQHGLSPVTALSLQPPGAEQLKDALVHTVGQAQRALERSRSALNKDVRKVEQLAVQPEYVAVVNGRLRERLQHDLTAPTRLAGLLEDIEEREQQVIALLAESAEDQARVVDACASTVEAVLDSVEEVARHSRLPQNLGSWSNQRFLSLELRQRARGTELARRLSAEVDRLITALPASAAGRASALPDALPLAKRLVLAALGGRGNIVAKIIKPTQNLDTVERESVTEIQKFSGGELLTVSVLLYCTLARMRAAQRDQRIPGGVGTLVLDNPFGKANYGPFVDLQRRVAAAHGIQLVYTTGSNDLPALGRFPLIIRMRNGVDLRTKRRYVQILDRYGDAVAAGVTRAQDESIASAHLLRRAALSPRPTRTPSGPGRLPGRRRGEGRRPHGGVPRRAAPPARRLRRAGGRRRRRRLQSARLAAAAAHPRRRRPHSATARPGRPAQGPRRLGLQRPPAPAPLGPAPAAHPPPASPLGGAGLRRAAGLRHHRPPVGGRPRTARSHQHAPARRARRRDRPARRPLVPAVRRREAPQEHRAPPPRHQRSPRPHDPSAGPAYPRSPGDVRTRARTLAAHRGEHRRVHQPARHPRQLARPPPGRLARLRARRPPHRLSAHRPDLLPRT